MKSDRREAQGESPHVSRLRSAQILTDRPGGGLRHRDQRRPDPGGPGLEILGMPHSKDTDPIALREKIGA